VEEPQFASSNKTTRWLIIGQASSSGDSSEEEESHHHKVKTGQVGIGALFIPDSQQLAGQSFQRPAKLGLVLPLKARIQKARKPPFFTGIIAGSRLSIACETPQEAAMPLPMPISRIGHSATPFDRPFAGQPVEKSFGDDSNSATSKLIDAGIEIHPRESAS